MLLVLHLVVVSSVALSDPECVGGWGGTHLRDASAQGWLVGLNLRCTRYIKIYFNLGTKINK